MLQNLYKLKVTFGILRVFVLFFDIIYVSYVHVIFLGEIKASREEAGYGEIGKSQKTTSTEEDWQKGNCYISTTF